MKVLQKVATTPMRKSAREPEACFFAYAAREPRVRVLAREVHVGVGLSREECFRSVWRGAAGAAGDRGEVL